MRAVVYDKRVRFDREYPDPRPGPGECLVQVGMAGICSTDLQILRGYMGFHGVLGHEMVGTVVSGPASWRAKRVACEINCVCSRCDMCQAGLANHCRKRTVMGIAGRDGCFADMVCVPERNLHLVPDNIADEEAVFIEPLAAAYQVRAQCPVDSRTQVAVVGTGKLGLLVTQVLARTGCRLTAIGRNWSKLVLCEKQGVQAIHNSQLAPRQDRDVVVECTGSPHGLDLALQLVRPRGTVVLKSTFAEGASIDLSPAVVNEVTILGSRCGSFAEAASALERKEIDVRPLISGVFRLDQFDAALAAAGDSNNLKILLRMQSNQ